VVALSNGCLCCSLSDNLQDAVWKLLQGDYSDFSERQFDEIDYLVIETSGITDPLALIELLERKYGKMTRVRLDCVITIMDTDAMYAELAESEQQAGGKTIKSEIAMNQLRCADVVLLNKKDVVTEEQLQYVESWVANTVPFAAIYPCEYSRVPLPHILDVEYKLFESGAGAIQRETMTIPYILQPRGELNLTRFLNLKLPLWATLRGPYSS
jgi:G3E family GTPase